MSSRWRNLVPPSRLNTTPGLKILTVALCAALASMSCGGDSGPTTPNIKIASIVIADGPRQLELGATQTLVATAFDTANKVVPSIPFVWKSSIDSVASFGPDGKLTAKNLGATVVTASALGVTSGGIQIVVQRTGAVQVAAFGYKAPAAASPGGDVPDSLRVLVTNAVGGPAVGAKVAFSVTAGGGTVSPTTWVTVGASGTAAAKWKFGPIIGTNTVTATVMRPDSVRDTLVKSNPVTFSVKTFAAVAVLQGDNQSGSVLSPLPIAPSVRLVDTLGNPRAGVPITFTATTNGRVANAAASTSSDGVASPGTWTLGDVGGDQQLIVTVEAAKVTMHATASGSVVRFAAAAQVATAQSATCVVTSDQFSSCMGRQPEIGTGDTVQLRYTPTLTKGGVHFTSLVGGGAHFCGTATDLSIYCWGIYALTDTLNGLDAGGNSPATPVPSRVPSNIAWLQVTPGGQHNCALANDRTAYCWGLDTTGQLGDNSITRHLAPKPVAGGFKFTALAAGLQHECGIALDATALCWGLNANGQLGDGTLGTRLSPTAVSGGLHWKAIAAGVALTCGLTQTGGAYCWGANTGSQVPLAYTNLPDFATLTVGNAHACALTSDGRAYCWGDNSGGQLGDSTTTFRATPTPVATTLRFAFLSAGPQHTCGVTVDSYLACWGRNQVGELGLDTPLTQLTPRYVVVGTKP
jgi:alpha-tubulin suppressor-like RCC1 family protein